MPVNETPSPLQAVRANRPDVFQAFLKLIAEFEDSAIALDREAAAKIQDATRGREAAEAEVARLQDQLFAFEAAHGQPVVVTTNTEEADSLRTALEEAAARIEALTFDLHQRDGKISELQSAVDVAEELRREDPRVHELEQNLIQAREDVDNGVAIGRQESVNALQALVKASPTTTLGESLELLSIALGHDFTGEPTPDRALGPAERPTLVPDSGAYADVAAMLDDLNLPAFHTETGGPDEEEITDPDFFDKLAESEHAE